MSTRVNRARFNLTPLATRIRDSVFTVQAAEDEGSGFVGWIEGRAGSAGARGAAASGAWTTSPAWL